MILGTAGHIDHGKTALVRALTGVDTDRLPEERRRGITIELGFAPLVLEDVGTVGVVDVPGHEAFVRTMVAGASGVDLALLVVAADEGVMPQTREHVAILELLGVSKGVVALTKRDLVDDDWLALVEDDVRALLATTSLAGCPIVSVSANTGAGLETLKAQLREAMLGVPARQTDDLFRMPVDRAFTVRGTGTVVTGTIASGSVRAESAVRAFPGAHVARVRGVQAHGSGVDSLSPGARAAVALAGIDLERVGRGSVLVDDGAWTPTQVLRADVTLLASAPALRPRTRVRLHLGTTETGARVVAAGGALEPGQPRPVRLILDSDVVARGGDRFVLRSASPSLTIGGGVVTDAVPPHRRARPWPSHDAPLPTKLTWMLEEAGPAGITPASLAVRLGMKPAAVNQLISDQSNRVVSGAVYSMRAVEEVRAGLLARIDDFHRAHPLEPGAPLQEIRGRGVGSSRLVEEAIRDLADRSELKVEGGVVRRMGWAPRVSGETLVLQEELERTLLEAGPEPPSVSDLTATYGDAVLPLLRLLGPERVVQVEGDRFFHVSAVAALVGRLRESMVEGQEYSPADLRVALGITRKFLIPFLEFCDRQRVTERRGTGRVLCT